MYLWRECGPNEKLIDIRFKKTAKRIGDMKLGRTKRPVEQNLTLTIGCISHNVNQHWSGFFAPLYGEKMEGNYKYNQT